jgi:hypothetical protein
MNPADKKHCGLKIISVFLFAACLVQAMFIYNLIKKDPARFNNADEFSNFIQKQFKDDNKDLWESYEKFFNEDFFQKQRDPFAALEQFRKKVWKKELHEMR